MADEFDPRMFDDFYDNDDVGEEIPMEPLDNQDQLEDTQETSFIDSGKLELGRQRREDFIKQLEKKFPDRTPNALLNAYIKTKEWVARGKTVRGWFFESTSGDVRLTGADGKLLAKSTIKQQSGGSEFFNSFDIPLEPTVVNRQPIENIEMNVLNDGGAQLQDDI